jgi:hydrogenase/urease accessory protein HupE
MTRTAMLAVVAFGVAVVTPARAHEIGTTQVTATFRGDGTYQFDIAVDPDALLTRLQVAAGETPSSGLSRGERDRRIHALAAVFLDRTRIRFDGVFADPAFAYAPASALSDLAQAPSFVRLTGCVPSTAQTFTLMYELATGSFALNVRIDQGAAETVWLNGSQESPPISFARTAPATRGAIAWQYFGLGYTHILPKGLDHILFVLGIFLLSVRGRSILLQVSAFTLAHSITLGLTMYGIVSLPARVVEPMIAVSIAYVAIENLCTSQLKSWRVALVFSFGLLHGMGFAGVLRDLGLPRSEFLTALLSFNVGVEVGQLTVIAMAFAAVVYWRRNPTSYRRFIVQPASVAIALAGFYWMVERVAP